MNFSSFRKYIGKVDHKLLIVIGFFVVAGLISLAFTRAASQSVGVEAENGVLAKGATYVSNSSASGGSAIAFGSSSSGPGTFQKLASVRTAPAPYSKLIGAGATAGSQKFYLGYENVNHPFALVTVDPKNNYAATTYISPLPSEFTASQMAVGVDNNVYIGTKSTTNVHIFKFTTASPKLVDLGAAPVDIRASVKQTYIWNLTASPVDHRLYGCTYPSADLVSYGPSDPIPHLTNLGTVDSSNQYGRYCVADPAHAYIYIGTGSINPKIVAYNIQTKQVTVLSSVPGAGFARVWLGSDNKIYGTNGTGQFSISNGVATPVTKTTTAASAYVFSNGDKIALSPDNNSVVVKHPDGSQDTHPYAYGGAFPTIFRVAEGPNNEIYAGTVLPFYLTKYSPTAPAAGLTNLGYFGGGEPYSMLTTGSKLAIGAYSAGAPLLTYDPALPVVPNPYISPACSATTNPPNPQCIRDITGLDSARSSDDLRPKPLIAGLDGNLYTGSVGHYGQTNGPLVKWNQPSNTASAYYPFPNLGISSLASVPSCQGITGTNTCLVAGTTTDVGGGATVTATTSPLIIWNTATNSMVKQLAIPAVSNITEITCLILNPANNYVYGVAINATGSYLFIFNPKTGTFVNGGTKLTFPAPRYNSVAIGSDGNIWGVYNTGIFKIDVTTNTAQSVTAAPVAVTTGFALVKNATSGDKLYFGSDTDLYVYNIPATH